MASPITGITDLTGAMAPAGPSQINERVGALERYVVGRFASTTARDAAIPSPTRGMVCITTDTDTLWQRDAAAWRVIAQPPSATDTGWLDCVIRSGFAPIAGAEKLQVRRKSGVVYMRGGILSTGLAINATFSVADLPSGFSRPPAGNSIEACGSATGAASAASGFVQTDGVVSIRIGGSLGGYYKFDRSYLVD